MARVLVTRPEPGATATAGRLAELGHEPVLLPLSEIRPLNARFPDADAFDVVAATSANAFRHLPAVPEDLRTKPCYAVGARSAEAARLAGFADVRQGSSDGDALAAMIASAEPAGRVVYLCGRLRRPDFERELAAAGFEVRPVEVYDTIFISPAADRLLVVAGGRPFDAVLLYSAESARHVARVAELADARALLRDATYLCLSDQVAAAVGTVGDARTYVAMKPTEQALLALLPPD